jgi:hypothetical protein
VRRAADDVSLPAVDAASTGQLALCERRDFALSAGDKWLWHSDSALSCVEGKVHCGV